MEALSTEYSNLLISFHEAREALHRQCDAYNYDNLYHIYNTWASGFNCDGQTTSRHVCRPLCIPQSAQLHNVNWTKNRKQDALQIQNANGDFVVQRQRSLPDKVPRALCVLGID